MITVHNCNLNPKSDFMGAIAVLFIISIIISEILAGSNNKDAQKKVKLGTAMEVAIKAVKHSVRETV